MPEKIERRMFFKYLLTSGMVLTSTGSISSLFSGCESQREVGIEMVYDFLEHLNEAEVVAPAKEYVKPLSFTVSGKTRDVVFEHPDSGVTFKNVSIYQNARLTFGIGISQDAWDKAGDGVLFEIILTDKNLKEHPVYSRYIDPKHNVEERKWFDEVVDLKPFAGKKVSFTFKTSSGAKQDPSFDWSGWSEPQVNQVKTLIVKPENTCHPNVLLIVIDTLRADHLGCYGNRTVKTPTIDQIASEGVLFENHFSQGSITNPSIASILTSLYYKNHRVYDNYTPLNTSALTLAEIFKASGYKTIAAVSAFHLNRDYSGLGKGFDDYYDVTPPSGHKGSEFIFLTRSAGKTNEKVFQWLGEHFREKFFMWIHYFDPHAPYSPPQPFSRMYYSGDPTDPHNRGMKKIAYPVHWDDPPEWLKNITDVDYVMAQYKGEVTYADREIGRLVNLLKKLGLEKNTLLILTADHGESLGEHHLYFDHRGLDKVELHVPFILKCPQLLPAGKRIKPLSMGIDIVPTIVDLLEIPCTKSYFDGQSLLQATKNKEVNKKERWVYSENMDRVALSMRSKKWAVIKDLEDLEYTTKYHFIEGRMRLYDTESDPQEEKDIASNNPEIIATFDQQLIAWLRERKNFTNLIKKPEVSEEVKEKLRALGYAK